LCRYDVQRRCAFEKHSGDRERHSGIGRKPFAFPPESPFTFSPESLFAFTPESFSRSPRNPFHLPPESASVRVEILRLNEQGKPIYYGAKQATTSIDGSYQFSELPQGPFQIGVNLFRPPDVKTPFRPTNWSEGNQLAIFLKPGEQKLIRPFRLPKPAAVRRIEAKVQWTDGRPASGVTVWGEVGDQAAASDETDENGLASLDLLEGVTYNIEGKIWIVTDTSREVARSGPLSVTPESTPLHLTLIMSKRSHYYR
jgi:hypothetical protein